MYWYFIHDPLGNRKKIVDYFNQQKETKAFIPKIEKWLGCKSIKDYVLKDLYPNYFVIQSHLEEKDFLEKHKVFLREINGSLLHPMSSVEQSIYERLFNQNEILYHSTGNIVEEKLVVEKGPLKGLEAYIKKINRHKRECLLDVKGLQIKMPLEVVSRR